MTPTLQMLGAVCFGVALACSDGTAPVYGAGCGEDQQSSVVLEGELRPIRVDITREYPEVSIVSSQATTYHYRTCQSHTRWEARDDPAAPLAEADATAALARCTAQADAKWAVEHPA